MIILIALGCKEFKTILAFIRLLPCVDPHMLQEVEALIICLLTIWTFEYLSSQRVLLFHVNLYFSNASVVLFASTIRAEVSYLMA